MAKQITQRNIKSFEDGMGAKKISDVIPLKGQKKDDPIFGAFIPQDV